MDWNDRTAVVTGAGGFIGSHLVERLVHEGAKVVAFTRYNSRGDTGYLSHVTPEVKERITILMGDLRDAEAVRRAVRGADTVFHLGALIAIPYSYVNPREVIETNVLGTFNVLTAASEFGVRRLVHTSTSEVYGTAQYVPIDEAHPLQGQSPYSASKIAADKIVESYFRSFDLPVATLRPFNTYGPRQSMRAVIPTIITQALSGSRVRLGSLAPSRDFTYVTDTVDGFVRIASIDEAIGHTINIGGGFTITIGELAHLIFRLLGREPQIVTEEQRIRPEASEVLRLFASNELAQDLLDWSPNVSLEQGLTRTIEWIRTNLDRFSPAQYAI